MLSSNPVTFRHKRSLIWWLFAALWFAAWHVFITLSVWADPTGRVPGPIGDNFMMMWNLGWVKHAFDHGSSGFWSPAAYFPDGYLFIYGSHTWLDGFLYWAMSWLLPRGWQGAVLWTNITMLLATVGTGMLIVSALRAWGVRQWPVLILVASGATFSWFRMFALFGHYNFFGTQWMLLAVCVLSWAREAFGCGNERQGKWLCAGAGVALGVSFLNDQTMAIFAGILGGLILLSLPEPVAGRRIRLIIASGSRYFGMAILPASLHLVPVIIAATQERLHYHVDKTLPRLVDASSLLIPNSHHFVGQHLKMFRESSGLSWAEGTYLGLGPILLLLLATITSVAYAARKSPDAKILFYVVLAAWGLLIIGLGDRLMIGREQYIVMPGRLLKEIPLFNNLRVPQRWVWPAHLCIALAAGLALTKWAERIKSRWIMWGPIMALATIPPLEGRSYPMLAPVDFRNDPFIRPPGLIESVEDKYKTGGVLTMPVELTYAHADILQFFWGYDIPMSVVYTARMPLVVNDLPWKWNAWTPEAGKWLREKQVSMLVFPYHGGNLEEFQGWISEAKKAVPGLVVVNKNGEEK